jgi:3alpha(or 20beta)-hydroxysteroid dehydrogenase
LAQYNIRVNSIHPGLVHTPLSAGVTEEFMRPIPLRRGAAPGEVAEFVVDGGLTSYVPTKI